MTLINDLKLLETATQNSNVYERYNLLENPFPTYGETRTDVCTDQTTIKQEFVNTLRNFEAGAKRMRINGESGAGKTNILRYFEFLTEEARRRRLINGIYAVYISAPDDNYLTIHEQIVEQLLEYFLGDTITALETKPDLIDTLSNEIKSASEILMALQPIINPQMLFDVFRERRIDAFGRWLKGRKLSTQDKRDLGGIADISSASLAIRFLDGLLQVLKKIDLCQGIVLLFDEFEEIFESLTRSRHSRYAQDLRHLFDTLQESVFFVIATVAEPQDLAQYPAIIRRLGEPLSLQPIDNADMAIDYVKDYLYVGRKLYFDTKAEQPKQDVLENLEPFSIEIISKEYEKLKIEAERAGLNVLPGYFLPRIRQLMQSIAEDSLG
ncbi:MAG: DUF2791 family P-loop domain-containing protein [Anaerolineae bacterium]|nr:DUF2791 family P-loop domain-containing protein [Anaerolineae bacterium]